MILILDIGNSNIVIGVMENKKILYSERIRTTRNKTVEEFVIDLNMTLKLDNISIENLEGCIISSVVPEVTDTVKDAVKKLINREPMILGRGLKTGINICTDNPSKVGNDLIADAVGAVEEYIGPYIVFDMGTATTCSIIDNSKNYIGTLIIPGVYISLNALADSASQLPHIEFDTPPQIIGKNTVNSMQSGIIYSNAAMIDGIIDRIENEIGEATVIVTGGVAGIIVPHCKKNIVYDPDLIMKGLWYIYNKNI